MNESEHHRRGATVQPPQTPSRLRSTFTLVAAVLLGVFSVGGYVQAGMLQPTGYRTAAWIYLGLFMLSVVVALVALVLRRRGRDASRRL
jgi:ABC-type thiamin/hydroxymethylpyrimidine transport system permease subunit